MKKLIIILFSALIFFGCEEKQELKEETAQRVDESVSKKEQAEKKILLDAFEDGLHIADAWIRPAGKSRNTGMFFRVINNTNENDTLLSAKSELSQKTEIHETYKEGDMMGMREVDHLVMEAGNIFQFKPMSYHVMLIKLNEALAEGEEGEVTLIFKNAGEVKVTAKVEDKMPTISNDEQEEMKEVN